MNQPKEQTRKWYQRVKTTSPAPQPVPTFGIALSGGSAKGFVHVGLFRFFEEHHSRPDLIAGTSAGALMGALYADGYRSDEIIQLFDNTSLYKFTNLQIPHKGLLSTDKFREYLEKIFRHERLEDLPTPLTITATNLDNGTCEHFTRGNLVDIVLASCSIPVLFNPVVIDNVHYVDGGLFCNLPARPIRQQSDYLLGVNLTYTNTDDYKKNLINIAERSFNYIFSSNAQKDLDLCDGVIQSPEIGEFGLFDIEKSHTISNIGYELACELYTSDPTFANLIDQRSEK